MKEIQGKWFYSTHLKKAQNFVIFPFADPSHLQNNFMKTEEEIHFCRAPKWLDMWIE